MTSRRIEPARVGRPWGGDRFGMVGEERVGELWVSGDDATLLDGRTLVGAGLAASVPLVKLLDVGGQLSIQVHPDDVLAVQIHGPGAVGKHETWVILEAAKGATISIGLAGPDPLEALFGDDEGAVQRAVVAHLAVSNTVIDVPPGTVHAPGPGVLVYEVQQRSNLTYRIFDWGRARPLHRDEASRAIRLGAVVSPRPLPSEEGRLPLVDSTAPFRLELCRVSGGDLRVTLDMPAVLSPIGGGLMVDGTPWPAGSHWLVDPGVIHMSGYGAALLAAWR